MLIALRFALGLLVLVAVGYQLSLHVSSGYPVLNFFSYFTNLSNLFAAFVLLLTAIDGLRRRPANELLRAISVVNMTIVGLVFAVLLRNVDLGDLRPWVNFVVHTLMPCAVVADWLLQPPRSVLGGRQLLLALIFPTLYLAYVLLRGSGTGWYPYPFLNPATVGGYGAVAAYAVGIAVTFLLAGWGLFALGNRLARRN